ncbi:MAG: DUF3445 domain-containing protein [Pseudomonadota bacterium]
MILQDHLPYDIGTPRPLTGVAPIDPSDWLIVDEAFGAQMAEREALLNTRRPAVLAERPEANAAASELRDEVLSHLPPGFVRQSDRVQRPDGVWATLDADTPLATLGRLVQEDLCLIQKPDGAVEHILTAAVLCFPSRWSLAEKLGRPLTRIHGPVNVYNDDVARRVQRLFDGLQPGRPLWRWNATPTNQPALFRPMTEIEAHADAAPTLGDAEFLRSERQVLWRLPRTRAVVFSIHTYVLRMADVTRGPRAHENAITRPAPSPTR